MEDPPIPPEGTTISDALQRQRTASYAASGSAGSGRLSSEAASALCEMAAQLSLQNFADDEEAAPSRFSEVQLDVQAEPNADGEPKATQMKHGFRWVDEFSVYLGAVRPIMACQAIFMSTLLIDLICMGNIVGYEGIQVAALGNAVFNTAFFYLLGMTTKIDTRIAQSQGTSLLLQVDLWFQRGSVCIFVMWVVMLLPFWYSGSVLKAIGHPQDVADKAGTFARIMYLALLPQTLAQMFIKLLLVKDVHTPSICVSLAASGINIILDVILTPAFGYTSIAWATVVARWVQLGGMIAYVAKWPDLRGALRIASDDVATMKPSAGISDTSFRLRLFGTPSRLVALLLDMQTGGVMVPLEAWVFDLSVIWVGTLGDPTALAAHAILLQVVAWTYTVFPFSIGLVASMRVAVLVGRGQGGVVPKTSFVSVVLGTASMLVFALLMLCTKSVLGRLWTADSDVIAVVDRLVPVAAAFQVLDGLQGALSGVIRGISEHRLVALSNFLGFWVVGISSVVAMDVFFNVGVIGAWLGLLIGLFVVSVLGAAIWLTRNWASEVVLAQARLDCEHKRGVALMLVDGVDGLLPFHQLMPNGLHMNQDCIIPFKWAAYTGRNNVYISYLGLDVVGSPNHMHVAGQTDNLLDYHSVIAANRGLLLTVAAFLQDVAKSDWKHGFLHIFRGRSGLGMASRLELAIRQLCSPQGTDLLGGTSVKFLNVIRAGHGPIAANSVGLRGSIQGLTMMHAPTRPIKPLTFELEVDGRQFALDVWIGYRGMDLMFQETAAADNDAGLFIGVSGVMGVPSAALICPDENDMVAYVRPTASVHHVDCGFFTNKLTRACQELIDDVTSRDLWPAVNQCSEALTIAKMELDNDFNKAVVDKKITKEGALFDSVEVSLRKLYPCSSVMHCAARESGFVSTREGIVTYYDMKMGAQKSKDWYVENLPGTKRVKRRHSSRTTITG